MEKDIRTILAKEPAPYYAVKWSITKLWYTGPYHEKIRHIALLFKYRAGCKIVGPLDLDKIQYKWENKWVYKKKWWWNSLDFIEICCLVMAMSFGVLVYFTSLLVLLM